MTSSSMVALPDQAHINQSVNFEVFQKTAPVKVVAVAKALGVAVWDAPLPPGVSGKLFKADPTQAGPSGFAIYVNEGEPQVRKRFTVAHEIGHFVLHRHELDAGAIEDDSFYRSRLSNRMEAQANQFAADLLMPWGLIDDLTRSGIRDPDKLAERFEVSITAMKIRLGLPT